MAKFSIIEVPPGRLEELWKDHIAPIMALPVEKSNGEVTMETTYNRIKQGIARLFIVIEDGKVIGLNTFEIRVFDSGVKALYSPMMGGVENKMMEGWGEVMHELSIQMAKNHGCREIRAICARTGWLKVLKKQGWKEEHTIMSLGV